MGDAIVRMITILFGFKADASSKRDAEDDIAKFAQNAMRQLKAIGAVAATIAFDAIVQNLLKATSQAEDTAFKFENIYGDLSDAQEAWAEDFADTYNRSATKVKESLAEIQHEMLGFTKAGTDQEKKNVSELSKTIEQAGLSLGAFYGIDSKTAISTLMSALEGSDAAMQEFNVGQGNTLHRNRQEAMRELHQEGALTKEWRNYEGLTPYERSLVNLRTVLNANKEATDALMRSQSNYSTMQANLNESLEELRETLGEFVLPTAKKIVDFLVSGVRLLNGFIGAIKKVTDSLGLTEYVVNSLAVLIAVLVGTSVVRWALGIVAALQKMTAAMIGTAASGASMVASVASVVAILAAGIAVVSDFNNFLRGESSKTGEVLAMLGINAEKAKPFIEGLRNVVIALTVALTALRVASIVTGTAIMATPVGWIIVAIAALIAIIVTLVKHWDAIKEGFTKAFAHIKEGLANFVENVKQRFQEAKNKIAEFVDNAKNKALELKDKLKAKWDELPAWIRYIISFLANPVAGIVFLIKHFKELREEAARVFNAVREFIGGAVDWVKQKFNDIPDWALIFGGPITWILLLIRHFDELKEAAKEAWEFVKNPFGIVDWAKEKAGSIKDALGLDDMFSGGVDVFSGGMAAMGTVPGVYNAYTGGSYDTRNFTQHITFNQEFNGPESMENKLVRSAADSTQDITSSLARLVIS